MTDDQERLEVLTKLADIEEFISERCEFVKPCAEHLENEKNALTILSRRDELMKLEGARMENARYSVLHGLTAVPMHEIMEREAELNHKIVEMKKEESK